MQPEPYMQNIWDSWDYCPCCQNLLFDRGSRVGSHAFECPIQASLEARRDEMIASRQSGLPLT
jgi:hypothetical protein